MWALGGQPRQALQGDHGNAYRALAALTRCSTALERLNPVGAGHDSPATSGSEMICVGEKAPTFWIRQQVIRRLRIPNHRPFGIQGVPPHSRKGRMLTKPANIDRDWRPGGCSASSIGVHDRCEVIANRLPIWEMNKYAAADRQEGIEAHLRDCLRIMVAIPTGILLNERLNGRGHETTLAAAETYGQWEPQRTTSTQHVSATFEFGADVTVENEATGSSS
jgi:hypothetical protein